MATVSMNGQKVPISGKPSSSDLVSKIMNHPAVQKMVKAHVKAGGDMPQGEGWNMMRQQHMSQGLGAGGRDWLSNENAANPPSQQVINRLSGKPVVYQNAVGKPPKVK